MGPNWSTAAARRTATAFLLALALGLPASATTYTITATHDGVAVDGDCTLREALQAAQTNLAVNECPAGGGADTIVLQTVGTYVFNQGQASWSAATLTIRGATGNPANHVINLDTSNRFLEVNSAVLVVEGLTLAHGNALSATPVEGGCLALSSSELALRDVVFSACTAARAGGLYYSAFSPHNLLLERVRFEFDMATSTASFPNPFAGAAYLSVSDANAVLTDVTFDNNEAQATLAAASASGGALVLDASGSAQVVARRLTVSNNLALGPGGGNYAGVDASLLDQAQLTLLDSLFDTNGLPSPTGQTAAAFRARLQHTSHLELRRLVARFNTAVQGDATQVLVQLEGSSIALVDGALLHSGNHSGLVVQGFQLGAATVGQVTAVSNANRGIELDNLGTAALRLENSLAWGNGVLDFVAFGTVDADRATNHNWLGTEGDPDPLFSPAGDFSLQPTSPARDAGDASFASVGPYDVRHAPRLEGTALDLGAFEVNALFADGFESGDTGAWTTVVN